MQRWQANYNLINELCFAKKLTPYWDSRIGIIDRINGINVLVFQSLPNRKTNFVEENAEDIPKSETLPEDAYFYWTEIMSFENTHPEIRERVKDVNNSRPVSDVAAKDVVEWNETLNNGQPIDWGYWNALTNITPIQAAKLAHLIDPILWPDDSYAAGKTYYVGFKGEKIDNDLYFKIKRREQQLENHSLKWNLANLVKFLGEDNAPYGMLQVTKELTKTKTRGKPNESELQAEASKNGAEDQTDTRASQLHALIWRVYHSLCSNGNKASAQRVWRIIQSNHEQYDTEEIIQEVTADKILWVSAYGNEQPFKRISLDAVLSRLKKNPPS